MDVEMDEVDSLGLGNCCRVPQNDNSDSEANGNFESQDERDIVIPPILSSLKKISPTPSTSSSKSKTKESADSKKFSFWRKKIKNQGEDLGVVQPYASVHSQAFEYNMNHENRGKAIIFNHTTFHRSQQLQDRPGSDKDTEDLKNALQQLNFVVEIHKDLEYQKIREILEQVASENHENEDCILIVVMTHGKFNVLHAYDIGYRPDYIWNLFTADQCSSLAGKPKMFFIQACRGDQYDHGTSLVPRSRTVVDGPGDIKSYKIPNQADFLTVFSTAPALTNENDMNCSDSLSSRLFQYLSLNTGHFSWRSSVKGSCFVQALCRVFSTYAKEMDVLSMITVVNREVAINYESNVPRDVTQHQKKQVPHVSHTLTRLIKFSSKNISTLV